MCLGQRKHIVSFGEDDSEVKMHLLLHDLHVRLDVSEDSGLDLVAFFAVAGTADVDGGAFGLAGVGVGHDELWRKANEKDE